MIDVDMIVRTLAPAVAELGLDLYDVERHRRRRAPASCGSSSTARAASTSRPSPRATQAVSPILDAPPLDAALAGSVHARGEQPGPRAAAAHARRTSPARSATTVSVKFRTGPARERVRGVVVAADDDGLRPARSTTARREHVAYDDIAQARTVFEWGPANRKPGTKSKHARAHESHREGSGTAMNSEMMEALENIEREKGISIEIMLEALANALVTAYKRMPDAAEEALVEIDVETGEIQRDRAGARRRRQRRHASGTTRPNDFGRIAAQTAKQVILQRIREAEREMKYEEYAGREGDIVTGIIQQTDAALHAARPRQGRGAAAAGRAGARTSATTTAAG